MQRGGWVPELFGSRLRRSLNGSEVEAGPKETLGVGHLVVGTVFIGMGNS